VSRPASNARGNTQQLLYVLLFSVQLEELHNRREDDRFLAPAAQPTVSPEDSYLSRFGQRDSSSFSTSFHEFYAWPWTT
jgi:hypothetical protein